MQRCVFVWFCLFLLIQAVQFQTYGALFCSAQRASFPGFFTHCHVSAAGTHPHYLFILFVQGAVFHLIVQFEEYGFVLHFHLGGQFKQVGDILKALFARDFGGGQIYVVGFDVFVVGGKFEILLDIPFFLEGKSALDIYVVDRFGACLLQICVEHSGVIEFLVRNGVDYFRHCFVTVVAHTVFHKFVPRAGLRLRGERLGKIEIRLTVYKFHIYFSFGEIVAE